MHEVIEELQSLQALLDHSIAHADAFLCQSFQMPVHSLSAQQLVHFWQDIQTIALSVIPIAILRIDYLAYDDDILSKNDDDNPIPHWGGSQYERRYD